ncbi:MAG: BTAD domain-containing putative transcriptional regulator, partial [Acidimicrobiia bacterium]
VSTEELIEAVWGDQLPSNPANTLQYQVAQLRKVVEVDASKPRYLITRPPGYVLDAHTTSVDASRFDALTIDARTAFEDGNTADAAALIDEALTLWRGPALSDFRYEEFAQSEAVRLDDARLAAEELRIDIALSDGRHDEEVPRLTQLTIEHPLREGLWIRQMTALYRNGQQTEALRAYQKARRALAEIGVEPSEELRKLEQRILDRDPGLDAPRRRSARTPNNLPNQPNELIGRDEAVVDVLERMDTSRLVTLSGPGGSGKTRLSIEVARRSLDRFRGGVWFVPLDQIDESSLVPAFVGRTIGIRENPDISVVDNLVNAFGPQPVLLVLDNAEHITDAVADLAVSLLARADELSVIATSQAVLGIQSEVVFAVDPLTLPGNTSSIYDRFEDVDAIALFLDRTTAAGTAIDNWDDDAYAAAANIVAALDGMPLAIELAAARTRSMSLDEIADGLNDRFALLSGGPRDAPPRQRTLAGTMEWSVGLLQPDQRSALRRLSVCAGDFDTAAAAAIAGLPSEKMREMLGIFVDRSLVRRTRDVGGAARFGMLETLRHYGIESLTATELGDARNAHLDVYTRVAEAGAAGICGPDQMTWLARIDAESPNLSAALAWSLESGDLDRGMRLGRDLGRYWDWKGQLKEATEWLARLSDADRINRPGRVSVLAWRSFLAWEFGETEVAQDLANAAFAAASITEDPVDRGIALSTQALVARSKGDLTTAEELCHEIISLGDTHGDKWMAAWAASALGTISLAAGDTVTAKRHGYDTIARFEAMGDRRGAGWGLTTLAQCDFLDGDLESALAHARHALAASSRVTDDRNVSWVLEILAEIAHAEQQHERAAQLWGAARPLRESRGLTTSISHQDNPIDLEQSLRSRLANAYDELFAAGFADPQRVIDDELAHLTDRSNSTNDGVSAQIN